MTGDSSARNRCSVIGFFGKCSPAVRQDESPVARGIWIELDPILARHDRDVGCLRIVWIDQGIATGKNNAPREAVGIAVIEKIDIHPAHFGPGESSEQPAAQEETTQHNRAI